MSDILDAATDAMDWLDGKLTGYSPQPAFDIQVEGKTVLPANTRLLSLTVTENRGFTADTVEIELDDSDGMLQLPKRGTTLSVAIGWQGGELVKKGLFVVDEITHGGPPDKLTISARSADFRDNFNVKREYSWHNCKVSYVVSAIAGRYGLTPAISTELADLEIDHADQTQESDISFLTRMAEMLGAATTIKNGMLLFFTPGTGRSVSGRVFPSVTITRQSGDRHSFRVADRDAYTGVEAYWDDLNFGKKKKTRVTGKRKKAKAKSSSREGHYLDGAEGNVYVMRQTYRTEQAARRAAVAKWQQLKRGAAEFSMTLARGRADLFPELHASMQGFKTDIDEGDWVITKAVHNLASTGFYTSLEFEVRLTDWVISATSE